MTPEEKSTCDIIDTLIKENQSFALWRIPGESPQFAMQTSGSVRLFYNIEDFNMID